MMVSVVIPTYNRPDQLRRVIACVLESETDGIENIEIIVVDDGSTTPVKSSIESVVVSSPFSLKYIYQSNAGPAAARNNGFREAAHETVLFIDDDILVFPDLIKRHILAHQLYPGSVICGQCPYFPSEVSSPSHRYLNRLVNKGLDTLETQQNGFARIEIVGSGNLSVEKEIFDRPNVYCKGLKTPVGEEFELSQYLLERDVPVFSSRDIKGWHLQPTTIEDSCAQNYKYGLGITELAIRQPNVLKLSQPRTMYEVNREIKKEDSVKLKIKKIGRIVLANKVVRKNMLAIVKTIEKIFPNDKLLFPLYRLVVGSHFAAGVVEGREMFTEGS